MSTLPKAGKSSPAAAVQFQSIKLVKMVIRMLKLWQRPYSVEGLQIFPLAWKRLVFLLHLCIPVHLVYPQHPQSAGKIICPAHLIPYLFRQALWAVLILHLLPLHDLQRHSGRKGNCSAGVLLVMSILDSIGTFFFTILLYIGETKSCDDSRIPMLWLLVISIYILHM